MFTHYWGSSKLQPTASFLKMHQTRPKSAALTLTISKRRSQLSGPCYRAHISAAPVVEAGAARSLCVSSAQFPAPGLRGGSTAMDRVDRRPRKPRLQVPPPENRAASLGRAGQGLRRNGPYSRESRSLAFSDLWTQVCVFTHDY